MKDVAKVMAVLGLVGIAAIAYNMWLGSKTVAAKKEDASKPAIPDESQGNIPAVQQALDKIGTEDMQSVTNYDASPRATFPTPNRLLVGSSWPSASNQDLQTMAKV